MFGKPTYGLDASVGDAYSETIAAPPGHEEYRNLIAGCATNAAILSLDAGTTGHVYVPAGIQVQLNNVPIRAAIHAKNAVPGSAATALHVIVW